MNLRIAVNVGSLDARLQDIVRGLQGSERVAMLREAGTEVRDMTSEYLRGKDANATANSRRAGAPHTGFFAQAAEKVANAVVAADSREAVLTINHVGFTRAFRSVRIAPKTAKRLAIPIHPASYGRRAAELWDRMDLFIAKKKDGEKERAVICATLGGVITPLYILVGSVTQKQDRTMLPSDEAFTEAARRGVIGYLLSPSSGLNRSKL